ncbi:thermonuclease family protein [Tabrizicola sp.]|uniref:thermonuclease family protein n=1 Tax=Tabrizicola sp. TaxID=2005166 RepID=UPI0026187C04|nr:thermonuclease family protein [Tabrizicola sp.]MDM7930287.1 thermonuclease family protein [Tabrizicola sp.]
MAVFRPARPPGPLVRLLRRLVDPRFYLKLVMVGALVGLLIVPTLADLVNAAMRPIASAEGACRIIRIVDGDTVTLICPEEGMQSARLLGFDTPEKYAPKCLDEFLAAERASWGLRTLIQKADRLTLTLDGKDQYGRALVRLELDGVDVARLMIRAGHARTYGGGLRGGWC